LDKEEEMAQKSAVVPLEQDERKRAHVLLGVFLGILVAAVVAEVVVRAIPNPLDGAGQRRWLEWLLVSLIGVCAYLVGNVAYWYHKGGNFIAFTPWYCAAAARGPVIALAILLALTNISFTAALPAREETAEVAAGAGTEPAAAEAEGAAPETVVEEGPEEAAAPDTFSFGIDFREASDEVLLVVAFLLGFFSKLEKELLFRIASFIFGDVFDTAYPEEQEEPGKPGKPKKP
jgi:hypothetical protein